MSLVAATLTAILPPYSPYPYSGDISNLQADDDSKAIWHQDWQKPPIMLKYVFEDPVILTGYVVAPPADEVFKGPNGWEVIVYRHGYSRDPWNELYKAVDIPASGRGWPDATPRTFFFPVPLEDVGTVTVSFGSSRSATDIGLSRLYFI